MNPLRHLLLVAALVLAQLLAGAHAVDQIRAIERELEKFDAGLMEKPRWLLLNKADLLPKEDADALAKHIVETLGWQAPWFVISGLAHEGTRTVMLQVQAFLDEQARQLREAADLA